MKKIILTFSFLLIFLNAKTQTCQGLPILSEDFNAGIPNSWTVLNFDTCSLYFNMPVKGYTGAWQAYEHYGRQGVADADRFTTTCSANDYLITPHITLGSAPVCLSWLGSTMYDTYIENYEILISTTTPDSTGFKANAPLAIVTNDVPAWTAHSIDLSAYAGQSVYIAFWNNAVNEYAIYLDDIRVSEPVNLDGSITYANFPDVVKPSSQVVSGQLLNGGLSALTSFNLNWQVGSGTVNTMTVSSANVLPSSFYSFTHSINWNPTVNGTYTIKIWANNLNGTNDMYPANDTLKQIVFVNTFPRKVLIEEFTQASCPPCASQNPSFDALVQPNVINNKISSIKYHTVWPGIDPMNVYDSCDVAQRVLYYGIGGVPTGLVDGVYIPNNCNIDVGAPDCMTQSNIDSAALVPSIFDITVTESKTSAVFSATVTLTAKTDIPLTSFSLYTVIMEDTIIYSTEPGDNGEMVFYQVARKMLPDSTGSSLGIMTNNESLTYTFSYTPDLTICNMEELHMVAFISNDATGHVYQSENTSLGVTSGIHKLSQALRAVIYPNPFQDVITVQFAQPLNNNTTCTVYDIYGRQVFYKNLQAEVGKSTCKLNLASLSNGSYLLSLEDRVSGKKSIIKIVK